MGKCWLPADNFVVAQAILSLFFHWDGMINTLVPKGYEHVQWSQYLLHFPEVVLSVDLLGLLCPTLVHTSVASSGKPRQCSRQEQQRRGNVGCPSRKHPGGHTWVRGTARLKPWGFWQFLLHSDTVLWKIVNIRERKHLVPPLFNAKLQIEFIVCDWWENDERNLKSFLLEVSAMQCTTYPHLLLNQSLRGKSEYLWMVKEKRNCF